MNIELIKLETKAGEDHKVLSAKIEKYSDILISTTRHERRYGKFVKLKKHEIRYAAFIKDKYNEVGWAVKVIMGLSPGLKREAWLNFKVPGWSKKES